MIDIQDYVNGTVSEQALESEAASHPKRRTFSKAYKRRILEEADSCTEPGAIGALLRREGLYSSNLTSWRRQRESGELAGNSPKKRGRRAQEQADEVAELRRENARLRSQLEQAEYIISAQKKLSQALEQTLSGPKDEK